MRRTEKMIVTVMTAVVTFAASFAVAAVPPTYPLDPLSQQELKDTVTIIRAAGHVDKRTRFVFLTLREPSESGVLNWKPGEPSARETFAIIKQGSRTYEAVIDLPQSRLESWREVKGVQPSILYEEMQHVTDILKTDAGWRSAMRKRGFENCNKIECMPFSAGYFGRPQEEGHRLLRVECYDGRSSPNYWGGRPIEGLVATVDLNQSRILELIDTGVVAVPKEPAEYDAKSINTSRAQLNPVIVQEPKGPDFPISA